MQLLRVLVALAAFVLVIEATFTLPTSFSSWLPFTFNITTDDADLGSVTLTVKPRFGREVHLERFEREVSAKSPSSGEKDDRSNKDSRVLFDYSNWELGLPSGASLTLGAVASMAGIIWTIIAENLEYKKEHGELDWKDGHKGNAPPPPPPQASSYGQSYPSYMSDSKPDKGFEKFKEAMKGFGNLVGLNDPPQASSYGQSYPSYMSGPKPEKGSGMFKDAMKGFEKLVGLKDLPKLLNPNGKFEKKPKHRHHPPPPMYQASYAPPPAYAPPAYAPPPAYAQPPAYYPPPTYNQDPNPAPANVPAPAPASPSYPPTPSDTIPIYPPQQSQRENRQITSNVQQLNVPVEEPQQSDNMANIQDNSSANQNVETMPSFPSAPIIEANGFIPIIPSPIDPLPFIPSTNYDADESRFSTGNVSTFGVPPPRASRNEDSNSNDQNTELKENPAEQESVNDSGVPKNLVEETNEELVPTVTELLANESPGDDVNPLSPVQHDSN